MPFWSYLANLRVCYGRELLLFKEEFTLFIYASPFMNLKSSRIFTLGRDRTGKLFLMLFLCIGNFNFRFLIKCRRFVRSENFTR